MEPVDAAAHTADPKAVEDTTTSENTATRASKTETPTTMTATTTSQPGASAETVTPMDLSDGQERVLAWSVPPSVEGWELMTMKPGNIQYTLPGSGCVVTLEQPFLEDPATSPRAMVEMALIRIQSSVDLGNVATQPTEPLRPRLWSGPSYVELPGVEVRSATAVGSIHAASSGRYGLQAIALCPPSSEAEFTSTVQPLLQTLGAVTL